MFPRPTICISACLKGENVRYNGQNIHDDFVSLLIKYCNTISVCPEIAIGLGVPRNKILVYCVNGEFRLYQPTTGIDITEKMNEFSQSFLSTLKDVDGFVLKAKSPSCGIWGTKIYKNPQVTVFYSKGKGLFAMQVLSHFRYLPVEDEKRLNDEEIRDHFLVRLFSLAELRQNFSESFSISALIAFHERYKYLLMTYNQQKLCDLGRIVAKYEKGTINKGVSEYKKVFYSAFKKKPSRKHHINTILHIFGYFSEKLNVQEKKHFLNLVEQYQENKIRRDVLVQILRNWAYRFNDTYLLEQRYVNPYPQDLAI